VVLVWRLGWKRFGVDGFVELDEGHTQQRKAVLRQEALCRTEWEKSTICLAVLMRSGMQCCAVM